MSSLMVASVIAVIPIRKFLRRSSHVHAATLKANADWLRPRNALSQAELRDVGFGEYAALYGQPSVLRGDIALRG